MIRRFNSRFSAIVVWSGTRTFSVLMIAGASTADFRSLMTESRAESSGAASPILLASCFLTVP
jgi:hypothetical protein